MKLLVEGANLRGTAAIPGSKSHTIRAVALAALADGQSVIHRPLESADAEAARTAYALLGATIEIRPNVWQVSGTAGALHTPDNIIDTGNSGTTMNIALGSAALLRDGMAVLTGDAQVRRRPNGPLAEALVALGARVESTRHNGCPPFVVRGPLRGGQATIEAKTSQYVTSLLINAPLAESDTELWVPLMYEKPYVGMTLDWLAHQGIDVESADDYSHFRIRGGQAYKAFEATVPGDFSSATFFLAAGALQDNDVLCTGLDMRDSQGDKAVVDMLRAMGADVTDSEDGIQVTGRGLSGCELDLNATPDALPMLAVLGCFARGTTRLVNVPQARLKETDRIAVMAAELAKLGGRVTEREDGLVIEESPMRAGEVEGHGDHRIVMALAIAGTMVPGTTTIRGAEAVDITFPTFVEVLTALGGKVRVAA